MIVWIQMFYFIRRLTRWIFRETLYIFSGSFLFYEGFNNIGGQFEYWVAIIIIMTRLVEDIFLHSKIRSTLKTIVGLVIFSTGAGFGYAKAKLQADIDNENYSQVHLKQYISEDQINYNIDKTGKPAVLYYYQPAVFHHYIVRHGFIKSSALGHQNADFYLVNLTMKLQKTIPELQHQFPLAQYLMEIRFPKDECEVVYTDGERVQKMAYRRQFFNHTYKTSGGVQDFLEENGILKAQDPMQDFFKLTKNCLFQPIKQEN